MNRSDIYDVLEICIHRLEAGEPLDQIISSYPEHASQLRDLLEMASLARRAQVGIATVPIHAQKRSRAKFLSAAGDVRSVASRPGWFAGLPRMHFSRAAAILLIVLLFTGLLSSGLVSAKSLPGDTLYPMKIAVEQARLQFSTGPANRLALEESFDHERLEESSQLVQLGREAEVNFAGFLKHETGDIWKVGGIQLNYPASVSAQVRSLEGYYVEVEGRLSGKQVQADLIQARLFTITGTLTSLQKNHWTVSGVNVLIDARSQVNLQAAVGQTVRINAIRLIDGNFLAVSAESADQAAATVTFLPPYLTVTITPTKIETETETHTPRPQPEATDKLEPTEHKQMETPEIKETPKPDDHIEKTPKQESTKKSEDGDHKKTEQPKHEETSKPKDD